MDKQHILSFKVKDLLGWWVDMGHIIMIHRVLMCVHFSEKKSNLVKLTFQYILDPKGPAHPFSPHTGDFTADYTSSQDCVYTLWLIWIFLTPLLALLQLVGSDKWLLYYSYWHVEYSDLT